MWKFSIIFASLLVAACVTTGTRNLHQVDAHVWRSAQPDALGFRDLKSAGIREVLSLRHWHADEEIAGNLTIHRIPMDAQTIRDADMIAALRVITRAKGPVLVHCWHGSDRTGAVIAMYRMVVQHWPREKALAEFLEPTYGYHAGTYPNIRHYLETVDIAAIRRQVCRGGDSCRR